MNEAVGLFYEVGATPSDWPKRPPIADPVMTPPAARAPLKAVLLHGPDVDLEPVRQALVAEGIRPAPLDGAPIPMVRPEIATVALIDDRWAVEHADAGVGLRSLPDSAAIVAVGYQAEQSVADLGRYFIALPPDAPPEMLLRSLQAAFRHARFSLGAARSAAELERSRRELREMIGIGMALMIERDLDRLLRKILDQAMALTSSDAGSLYLVEDDGEGGKRLRFKLSENASIPGLPFVEFTLPVDHRSIAGYVADTGEAVVIEDAYDLPPDSPYRIDRSFDARFGYHTRSVLVVPMADHRGVMVGVVQLLNRKRSDARITGEEAAREHVLPYTDHELALLRGLAGQAAVSIENARLYEQIESLFESFVRAAVAAIDQRDPTTAGHSVRVAALTTALARRLPQLEHGPWAGTRLSRAQMKELRYAALLHDFGKVGVREEVLVKAKKLPRFLWERVQARFDFIQRTIEKELLAGKLGRMDQLGGSGSGPELKEIEAELERRLRRLESYRDAIREANEPSILPAEATATLKEIAGELFEDVDGTERPYLEPDELGYLTIPKGSLDRAERREIESHVMQTHRFLNRIPWTPELARVPEIAWAHHERLDGRGYPRGIAAPEITLQTRLVTIADIFDALTASDRPYKRALSAERALDILAAEAEDGTLDPDLVQLLVRTRVYTEILDRGLA